MSIVGHDDPATVNCNSSEPAERTRAELEAARELNYQRAQMRLALDEDKQPPSQNKTRREFDWQALLIAPLVTGAVVALGLYAVESQREQRFFDFSQQLEDARAEREMRHSLAAQLAVKDDLVGIVLAGQDLQYIVLTGRNLADANLAYADLTGADLTGATLEGTDLTYAYLADANLKGANLSRATLTVAILAGADLTGADLTGATLDGTVLAEARWEPAKPPTWPEGFTPPDNAWTGFGPPDITWTE